MFKLLITSLFIAITVAGCNHSEKQITNAKDYDKYMQIASADSFNAMKKIKANMEFWKSRLMSNPDDAVAKISLAGLYGAKFKEGGDINDIHTSDSLYRLGNDLFKTSSSSVYRALAANCITQHKFRQAQTYIDTALKLGDDLYLTLLMQCDIAMELGDLQHAETTLDRIADKNNFDYIIRKAKLLDHNGRQEEAIREMEAATAKAISLKKDGMILWAKSNLGDMYGHANRFKEAYKCYLDVLDLKPDYLYALKGIAWLAFSQDRNSAEAKRILNYLSKLHPVPDYDLMLAKIAAYENQTEEQQVLKEKFITEVSNDRYGDMYNKYVFYLMTDEKKNTDKALSIAETEIRNRPTSQSYDLLAWAYYVSGHKEKALAIARTYVENRCFEPDAFYHLGMIYAGTGELKKAKYYIRKAEHSAFELGPVLAARIQKDLRSIKN